MFNNKPSARQVWLLWMCAIIFVALGLALAAGGTKLLLLGGSPYYILTGLAVLVSGGLMMGRQWAAARLYLLVLLATVIWAVWEVGFSGWLLVPRIAAPLVLGLVFAHPLLRRCFHNAPKLSFGGAAVCLFGLAVAFAMGGVLHAGLPPYTPADPMFQDGVTSAPQPHPVSGLDGRDWSYWGSDAAGTRFSSLDQITPANVDKLQVAWVYRTGPDRTGFIASFEAVPLKIDDTLYTCTDYNDVIALDAETGRQLWRYASHADMGAGRYSHCRGVVFYRAAGASGECASRILTTTIDARLIALDAASGQPCAGFGNNGTVDLTVGMGTVGRGYYHGTSAPAVVAGKVVVGGMVADGQYWGEPSGVIRAFDAVSGKLAWAWDMGRPDQVGEPPPGETYTKSTPNGWAPMSVDEALGLVYVPTGNASGSDYYGAQRRPFDDAYSSAVVALDAATGRPRWSFQTAHHDLWDYDVPSQPTLIDIPGSDGAIQHALIQPTKRGELFLIDRASGKALAEVEERPAPQRGIAPGERLAATQPFSVGMPSVAGPNLTERSMWGLTPLDQLWCRLDFRERRYDGPMTPPGLTPSFFFPGYTGGSNWGSVTVDRDREVMVVTTNRLATRARLMPRAEADQKNIKPLAPGVVIDMSGSVAQAKTPYGAEIGPMMSPLNVPCTSPPYGTISAIDLTTKKLIWTGPLGTTAGSGPFGLSLGLPIPMGVPNSGGAITTRSGLTFVAATQDGFLRALDTATGRELWRVKTPVPAFSTPMTYISPKTGRQFVVIAAAGLRALNTPIGDYLVAYAIPQ